MNPRKTQTVFYIFDLIVILSGDLQLLPLGWSVPEAIQLLTSQPIDRENLNAYFLENAQAARLKILDQHPQLDSEDIENAIKSLKSQASGITDDVKNRRLYGLHLYWLHRNEDILPHSVTLEIEGPEAQQSEDPVCSMAHETRALAA